MNPRFSSKLSWQMVEVKVLYENQSVYHLFITRRKIVLRGCFRIQEQTLEIEEKKKQLYQLYAKINVSDISCKYMIVRPLIVLD